MGRVTAPGDSASCCGQLWQERDVLFFRGRGYVHDVLLRSSFVFPLSWVFTGFDPNLQNGSQLVGVEDGPLKRPAPS